MTRPARRGPWPIVLAARLAAAAALGAALYALILAMSALPI